MNPVEFRIPADEYRVLPIPYYGLGNGHPPKMATCYVRVDDLPEDLKDWMAVNPRIPNFDKGGDLKGTVAKGIVTTLTEDPEKFVLMNQGIHLIAEKVDFIKESGGKGLVTVKLTHPEQHGLVNGGHTFRAIRQVAEDAERPDPWNAYVRLHIMEMEGTNAAIIAQIAEGLNRSLQVDNPSLENLRGTFNEIKQHLAGKPGAEQISYRQGDEGEVDIQQVLTYMSLLNINNFPDRKTHPNTLFGQPKLVLDTFVKDIESSNSGFKHILPRLHEILVLTDWIQKAAAGQPQIARLKVSNAKKQNRVRSERHKHRPAYFAGGTIGGNVPLGLLYPMVAAFRANISRSEWNEGRLEWLVSPKELLEATIKEMAQIVRQEYDDNKSKPAEVGRKEAAYRGCYSVIVMELAQRNIVTL
ncbi:AIPR family protein [Coleofasciculus sp. FACHB-1120]|uniref:AIPR family protein n=1 Tax=Coleofasciculus sp. FACHB-1120 TaxID=2692783 RepID=UPI0016837ABE|nr:AIPR family protein [Coleofasciculus sp. FACHB-1120]MBD2743889.1 AIPR family protein [Coleofasciculus sp. FACHB-1120]